MEFNINLNVDILIKLKKSNMQSIKQKVLQ